MTGADTKARSGTVGYMDRYGIYRNFLNRLETIPALFFLKKSFRYALQAIL